MLYSPDLTQLSLTDYQKVLKNQNLLPSRRLLLDQLDARFTALEAQGIVTIAQLLKALSTPAKIEALAAQTDIPAEYLTILRREIGTLKPRIVPLTDFPDTDPALIESLRMQGMKTSKDYFESTKDLEGVLYALCNLVRINGIGPTAAKMFCEAGYRSVWDIAVADAATLLERINRVNATKQYYQGTLGLKDMQFCIDFTKLLVQYGCT